ncbi:MAG: lamin tail domain-containing protein, partial [Candidatus Heimdallarchaeota archaeon]|nr:lamin tail domain-containing protein [Candidatus Heimdallarchaeota archaeon]MCK4612729.1 lamin tail domain-containing protein [Candidatus Heimdallarchaeota archaeon]
MIRKKYIVFLVILSLLLPAFVPFSANQKVTVASNSIENTDNITLDAITTETFSGITNITTFVGPDNAHEITLNSIKNAQTTFYLEVYTLSSESLIDELISAHGRGVTVIVQLSDDRVNSYEDEYTEEAAWRLDNAGIDVYWTSSSFTFTHAKFWIVDSQEVYVYSGNWAPSSIPESPEARTNREMGFIFNNAAIASYFEGVFIDDGWISTAYDSAIGHTGNLQAPETSGTYEHPFSPSTFVEYAEVTPIFSPDNSFELLSNLIQSAATSIDLELQYIKFDCDLLYDVIDAALRGVSIRVLIPEPDSSTGNVTETLINSGVQVKFFKGMYDHNKYVSVDGETVQVSSINWSNNSIENNREAGAIVKNANVAAYFKTVFDYDWANSETPVGFAAPVALVSPKVGGIASGSFLFQASFAINTYTSGELFIDGTSVHIWSSPTGIVGTSVNTDTYSDGIHNIKIVGTPTVGDPIEVVKKINIINEVGWKLFITEIRYDADDEPEGEFVEIYNAFAFDIYLENWKLTDSEGNYILPEGAQIAADDILIFAYDKTIYLSEMTALGVTAPVADYNLGDIQLANTGDDLSLKDPADVTKDAVAWGSGSVAGVVTWSGSTT